MCVMPRLKSALLIAVLLVGGVAVAGCGGKPPKAAANGSESGAASASADGATSGFGPASPSASGASPTASKAPVLPAAGNPNGHATVPAEARAEDTSHPTRVI